MCSPIIRIMLPGGPLRFSGSRKNMTASNRQALDKARDISAAVFCDGCDQPLYVKGRGARATYALYPGTGPGHRPDCALFEPFQGGVVERLLRQFSQSGRGGKSVILPLPYSTARPLNEQNSVARIQDFLGALWIDAHLCRWNPQSEGSRHIKAEGWSAVGRRLVAAAQDYVINGTPATTSLIIPRKINGSPANLPGSVLCDKKRLSVFIGEIVGTPELSTDSATFQVLDTEARVTVPRVVWDRAFRETPDVTRTKSIICGVVDPDLSVAQTCVTLGSLAFLRVSPEYLPVEGSLTERVISALVSQGRSFAARLVLSPEDMIEPCFVLYDADLVHERPPVLELWYRTGFPGYDTKTEQKRRGYQTKTRVFRNYALAWECNPGTNPLPPFPSKRKNPGEL